MAHIRRLKLLADPMLVREHADAVFELLPGRFRLETTRVGLVEALSNAIIHGAIGMETRAELHGFLDRLLEARSASAPRWIDVSVSRREAVVRLRLRDPGRGFDWRRTPAEPGRGLALIHMAFRKVRWSRRGNTVELTLRDEEVAA